MDLLKSLYKLANYKNKKYLFLDRVGERSKLITLLRVRNEELIINDTLNHLSEFSDGIVCYEDDSTDNTFQILKKHPKVIAIIRNFKWLKSPDERLQCETTHRQELLNIALRFNPKWIFCADADERYLGNIREFIESKEAEEIDMVRVSLFDSYITSEDKEPYSKGTPLINFRKFFGPERRDILMLWKTSCNGVNFVGLDSREPSIPSDAKVVNEFYCQHYGKALSVEHWEETCDYYMNHFPYEPYGRKWQERKGKAVHTLSDFNTQLYTWGEELFNNAIVIHPGE